METLTLYTNPNSRGRTARWMLEETGLPYETVQLEFGAPMKSPEYLAINPMGKVPALRHGSTVVTEVAAICAYLAELAPERHLAPPPGAPERATWYRALFLVAGPLEALMTAKTTGHLADAGMAGYGREQDLLATLEQLIGDRDTLCGTHFTAADLLVAAYLGWYMQFKLIEARPAFVRFAGLHGERPAAKRAREADDAAEATKPPKADAN